MNTNNRIFCLSELKNYKLHEDDPNILGWKTDGASQLSIGQVSDLVVDVKKKEAVYAEVKLHNRRNPVEEAFILIPVADIRLKAEERRVQAPFLDAWNLDSYPAYSQKATSADLDMLLKRYAEYIPDQKELNDKTNAAPDPASGGYYASTLRLRYLEMKKEEALKELVALNKEIAKTRLRMDRKKRSDMA